MMSAPCVPDDPQTADEGKRTPQQVGSRKRSAAAAELQQPSSKAAAAASAAATAQGAAGDVGSCTPGSKAGTAKHADSDTGQTPLAAAQQAGCEGMVASSPGFTAAAPAGAVEEAAAYVLHAAAAGSEGLEQRLRPAKRIKSSATAGTAQAATAAGQTPQAAAAAAEVESQGVGASPAAPAAAAAAGAHSGDDVRTTGLLSPIVAVLAAAAAADGTQQGLLSSLSGSAAADADSSSAGSPAPSAAGDAAAAVEGADPGSSWGAACSLSAVISVGDNWEPGSPPPPHRSPQQQQQQQQQQERQQQEQEEHSAQHSAKKQRTGSTQHLRSGMGSSLQHPPQQQQEQQQQQGLGMYGQARRCKLLPHHKQDEALRAAIEAQHMTEQDYIDRQARILKQQQKQRVSPDMSPGVQSRPPPGIAAAAAGWECEEQFAAAGGRGLRVGVVMLGYADSRQLQRERVQQQKQYWQDQLNRPLKQRHRGALQQQHKGQQQQPQHKVVQLRDAPKAAHQRGPGARRAVLLAASTAPQLAPAAAAAAQPAATATQQATAVQLIAVAAALPAALTPAAAPEAAPPPAPKATAAGGKEAMPMAADLGTPSTVAAHGVDSKAQHAAAAAAAGAGAGAVVHASSDATVHQAAVKGPSSRTAAVHATDAGPVSECQLHGAVLGAQQQQQQQQQQNRLQLAEPAVQPAAQHHGPLGKDGEQVQTLPGQDAGAQRQPPQDQPQLQQQQHAQQQQQHQHQHDGLYLVNSAMQQRAQQHRLQDDVQVESPPLTAPQSAAQCQPPLEQAQLQQQQHHYHRDNPQQQQSCPRQQQQINAQVVQPRAIKSRLKTLYEAKLQSSRQHLSQVPLPDLLSIMQGVAAAARTGYVPVQPANMQALCQELCWRRLQQLSEEQQQQQQRQGKVVGEVLPGRAGPACNRTEPDDVAVQMHAAQQQQQQVQGGAASQQRVRHWQELPRWQQKLLKRMKPPKLACQQGTGQSL